MSQMQTIEIQKGVRVGMEELMSGMSKMETPMLEKFLDSLRHIVESRKNTTAKGREEELLEKIAHVVPAFVKGRYKQLHSKMEGGDITKTELEELRQITNFMEEKTVDRIHLMAELAALRQVPLKDLAEQFRSQRYGYAEA